MPGPPRFYPDRAARQRAYRERQRAAALEAEAEATGTSVYAHVLHAAIRRACALPQGEVARQVYREDPFDTLRALADHFYDVGEVPSTERPWLCVAPAEARREGAPAAPDSPPKGDPAS